MFRFELALLSAVLTLAGATLHSGEKPHAAASNWSPAVNGLRGRMLVSLEELALAPTRPTSLRYKIVLELANVTTEPIAVVNQPRIIRVELLDENGKAIPQHGYDQDGQVPFPQWAAIPRDAYLGIRVDMPGVGLTSSPRIATLAVGDQAWRLAPGTYTLRAQLLIENDRKGPDNQWTGQLQLPPATFTFHGKSEQKRQEESTRNPSPVEPAVKRAADLAPPVRIMAGGRPIVFGSFAAPFVGDYDGDGKNDLLVGQYVSGRLRIYRNVGTNAQPRFGSFEWFKAGGRIAAVRPYCQVSFTPQLVDFDGDGRTDILTGSGIGGEVFLFRRRADQTFDEAEVLQNREGQVQMHRWSTSGRSPRPRRGSVTALAYDWDKDGDADLLLGHSPLCLVLNQGTAREPSFDGGRLIECDGEPIIGQLGSPHMADWNGDGLDDLVAGLDRSIVWYPNVGQPGRPEFEAPRVLVSSLTSSPNIEIPDGQPGFHRAFCVADFNADGRLDLLLSDRFRGTIDEDNRRELPAADRDRRNALYKLYKDLRDEPEGETREERIERYRRQLRTWQEYDSIRVATSRGCLYRGYVWLYERIAPAEVNAHERQSTDGSPEADAIARLKDVGAHVDPNNEKVEESVPDIQVELIPGVFRDGLQWIWVEVSNESADKVAWLEPGGFPPEVLVDGVRYRSTWVDTEHPPFEKEPRTIRPGDRNRGGEFTLDRNWVRTDGADKLQLRPSRHVVRAVLYAAEKDAPEGTPRARIVSNPIEIGADGGVSGRCDVKMRFLGGAEKKPLEGLELTLAPSGWQHGVTATTQEDGTASLSLLPGGYRVRFRSSKRLPYLPLTRDRGASGGYEGGLYFYNHSIRVAETREEQLFDFNLADPCELVLRAVDVDTGEGIPGVAFVTENAGDEEWERPICHQTLGPNEIREMGVFEWEALDDASFQTDQQGYFRRYVGPRTSGWSYGIRVVPPGYEPVNRNGEVDWNEEVKIETPLGRKKAEHTFLLRRKKAAK